MGYCISLEKSTFLIKKENIDNVLKALNEFGKMNNELRWVDKEILVKSKDIFEIFEEIRYPLEVNENGDYVINEFWGEKLGNDDEIFEAIAKYVENSYIEILGEDGDKWRWVFEDGYLSEVHPKIVWQ